MTRSEIERLRFTSEAVNTRSLLDPHYVNWPVVYVIDEVDGSRPLSASGVLNDVYVGETLSALSRMRQHLGSPEKQHLRSLRVIIDETFNKSVCLDLESYLIRMLAGDGAYRVLNRNDGITDSDYFDRENYRERFREVFEQLRNDGVFTRTIPEIENSDLFKLSPFKALSSDQAIAVEDILEGLFADLASGSKSTIVIEGAPGTGKTVVAIYLMKLLLDIAHAVDTDVVDSDSMFSEFFAPDYRELLRGIRIGLVIPQQSLRKSIRNVFRRTPGLEQGMVMTAFDVGKANGVFDLLIVDESHRLNQRANQPSAAQNKAFQVITEKLFGSDDKTKTQLDWIRAMSRHQVFLLDAGQSVRPADLPAETLAELTRESAEAHRHYRLASQMRVKAGFDYVGHVRRMFSAVPDFGIPTPVSAEELGGYHFRMFDSVAEMRAEIVRRDDEVGLSRMLAGYAWEWKSKNDKLAFDIEVDGVQLRWNSTQTDWIASPGSLDEVGSIHTVQGYDLNYAGVIIGPDLRYDPTQARLVVDRSSYFDKKGKENNPLLGKLYSDNDLLRFVGNVYSVLLTRGVLGTYVYVCDPGLREHLRHVIPRA